MARHIDIDYFVMHALWYTAFVERTPTNVGFRHRSFDQLHVMASYSKTSYMHPKVDDADATTQR